MKRPRREKPPEPYVYAIDLTCRATDLSTTVPGRIRRVIHVAICVRQYNARKARQQGAEDVYRDANCVKVMNCLVEPAAADHFLALWRAGCQHTGASCRESGDYLTGGVKPPWGLIDLPSPAEQAHAAEMAARQRAG